MTRLNSSLVRRLAIRLRQRAPRIFRQSYRIVRSFSDASLSHDLPMNLVAECRVLPSRLDMLEVLPRHGMVAELGTWRGDFAREIWTRNTPSELHLVDIDLSTLSRHGLGDKDITLHEGITTEVIARFPDESFDWIYIDADHSYEGVLSDARASAPKIRRGGFLVFNDFAHIDPYLGRYGVHRAVTDFVLESSWPMRFLALQPAALYDIAIQRPHEAVG